MSGPAEGWEAVVNGGGLPAIGLALIALVVKGPSLLHMVSKEWHQEAAKQREEVDRERDGIDDWKNKELERLRSEIVTLQVKNERMIARIEQLMRTIGWWRDYARDLRHAHMGDLQRHQSYERLKGIDPLETREPAPVPAVAEELDASSYRA